MTDHAVFLSFGANLGNPRKQIEQGIMALEARGVTITERSSWYDTEPAHVAEQPWFLNLVTRAKTALEPLELLDVCKQVEKQMGRIPSVRFGPRHLDVDILLYEDRVVDSETLTIPHPRLHERTFVLIPLLEIAPQLNDPKRHSPYAEALSRLDEGKKVLRSPTNEY